MWHLMCYTSQKIRNLGGAEIYTKYGQQMIDSIVAKCTENFGTKIVRYPEDEEIIEVINYFKQIKE